MIKSNTWLIAVLVFYIVNYTTALRASQLILQAKTSSTTSTTETILNEENEEIETTEVLNNTSSKPTLTGIPQIDYIWDPNLPRELHGYNLTDYPFFNAVPPDDEIDFKCDGHHDGFYASVRHKCQLYHHCLFGNRYDFLCANFTAFDQRTFICHFVSEVDCKNSPKHFHRNDALYMVATTTTLAPPTTTSTTTTTTTTLAPQRRQGRPSRRPLRRKRPQYDDDDYFEDDYDYYEERSYRRRKQRPRHRRPDYDEEYEDRRSFGDERYDRRSYRNRNEEYEDDEAAYEGRRKYEPKQKNRNRNSNTNLKDNDKTERPRTDMRKGSRLVGANNHDANLEKSVEAAPPKGRTRFHEEKRYFGSERRHNQKDRKPTDGKITEIHSEETNEKSVESLFVKPSVSSSSSLSSLFDRPRAAPRISRPVPLNEKNKYSLNTATTTSTTSTTKPELDDEYYDEDDYEQDSDHKNVTRDVITKQQHKQKVEVEMEDDIIKKEEHTQPIHSMSNSKQLGTHHNYKNEYNQEQGEIRQHLRIVKRPFLPSRGGSPYLPRGLQPVGSHENEFSTESTPIDMGSTISGVRLLEHGQPILRTNSKDSTLSGSGTTLQPKSVQKLNIEDLYETEYDVTLNDALNPTLKPLSSDLRRRAAFPQTREPLSQTRIQESPRHPHNYYDY